MEYHYLRYRISICILNKDFKKCNKSMIENSCQIVFVTNLWHLREKSIQKRTCILKTRLLILRSYQILKFKGQVKQCIHLRHQIRQINVSRLIKIIHKLTEIKLILKIKIILMGQTKWRVISIFWAKMPKLMDMFKSNSSMR